MPDQSCATLLKASVTGQSRSSSASTLRKASKSFPEDGSSSAPLHGSTAAGDWPKIGKNPSQVHRHGYSLHISEPSRVKLQGIVSMRRVLNQTLRCQRSLPSQTGFRRRPIASTAQSGRAVGASRRGVAAIRRAADQLADNIRPVIHQIEAEGYSSLRDIAKQLNRRGVKTARGGVRCPTTVKNIQDRADV